MAVKMNLETWAVYGKRLGTPKRDYVKLGGISSIMQTPCNEVTGMQVEVEATGEAYGLFMPAYNSRHEVQIGFESAEKRLLVTGRVNSPSTEPIFRRGDLVRLVVSIELTRGPECFNRRKKRVARK